MSSSELRALVVEDDLSWQELVSELLIDNGFIVDMACTLDEAATQLKAYPHRLMVVDLSLASDDPHNTDGLHVQEAAHSLAPNLQAVLLIGFATVELAVSAMTTYRAFTVLRKESFSRDEFGTIVQQILSSAPIPATSFPAPQISAKALPATKPTTLGHALVVDDDAGWHSLLVELLEETGYSTRPSCGSFGEAFSYLQRETFTLAVIDLSLEGFPLGMRAADELDDMAGYRLLSQTQAAGIATIVVSGVATPTDIQRVYAEQGIFAYLEKQAFERDTFLRLAAGAYTDQQTINGLARLTEREREVLDWLIRGLTNKEIAQKMVITPNTVKRHLKAIFEKLEVNTRSAAIAKALELKH